MLQRGIKQRPPTNERGERLTNCAHPDCDAYPMDEVGAWRLVADRRWWCGAHAHLAAPDDHLPIEDPYALGWDLTPHPSAAEAERLAGEERRFQ